MKVERVKYLIWAADMNRAVQFYQSVLGAEVLKQNEVMADLGLCDSVIGIHSGGEGKRTWTGMSFQVADVIEAAAELVAAGGELTNDPKPENGEPPHLAMCVDTEGNEIMLFRARG